jgi:hypothetical protein
MMNGKRMVNSPSERADPITIDGVTGVAQPALPLQRTPLKRLDDVKRELGRVYRAVKAGTIPSEEGTRRAYILNTLSRVMEAADLERRLAELERQQVKLLPGATIETAGD